MALRNSLAVAQARRAELVEKRRRLYGGDVGASPQKTVRSGPQPSEPEPEPEPELEPLSDRRWPEAVESTSSQPEADAGPRQPLPHP
eukprot:COSAG06_NODE_24772_length_653_cov_0.812274_2_plen_86_part_01